MEDAGRRDLDDAAAVFAQASPAAVRHRLPHRLLTAFVAAAQVGDLSTLEELFAADVVSYSDGGGVALASASRCAARRPWRSTSARSTTASGPGSPRPRRKPKAAV
jgi:hypothetical protein